MKYCPDQDIRLEATARLAFNHCEMGRKEIGRAIYESLPSSEFCKENQIWWGHNDDEKLPFTRAGIQRGYELMSAGICSLFYYRQLPDEKLLKIYEKKFMLDGLIYDEEPPHTWESAYLCCNYAAALVRSGKYKNAIEQLKIAVEYVHDFDNRPDTITVSSLLLGESMNKKSDFETNDTRPFNEIMRNKWLSSKDFDAIRNTKEFEQIINQGNLCLD